MATKWSKYNEQLIEAIARKDLGEIRACVQQGAHINKICMNGMTPLGAAAETGSLYVLKALTDYSKKYHTYRTSDNKRPIKLRLEENHTRKNIGYFVFSADVDDLDNEGPTPEGMEGLEWDLEVNDDMNNEESPCNEESNIYKWYAKVLSQTAIILKSPENDITRLDRHGQNVLHYAVQDGDVDMVAFLFEEFKEFNVNQCNLSWHTPLHLATMRGNYDVVKYLIEKGADVNAYTMRKITALHFAANCNNSDIVKLLLSKGANPNVFDEDDRSPLTLAVDNDNVEIVQLLLKRSVRLNQEDTRGSTPLLTAVLNNSTKVAKILLESGAKVVHSHQLLHIATTNSNLEMIKILEKGGAILNFRDDHGYTPLMIACISQNYEIAEYYIQRGMSANAINQINGDTALHLVLASVKSSVLLKHFFDLFVSYGANLDIVTLQGGLYFHALVNRNIEGAKMLIKYGIDVNKVDNHTLNNFLIITKKHGTPELVQMVVFAGFNFRKWKLTVSSFDFQNINDPLYEFLSEKLQNPLSLKDVCRVKIRSMFRSRNIYSMVDSLPLPNVLKEYLTLDRLAV